MAAKAWMAACCIALGSAVVAADDSQTVGNLGDPKRLEVEGAKTFSADEIREAIFDELDVVAACDTNGSLEALISLLAEKATAGYQAAGFPDAKVTVNQAGDKLKATIDEGQRYTKGDVQVVGSHAIDAEQIKSELTPSETVGLRHRPLWQIDEPAPFNSQAQDWLRSKVAGMISDQGFYRPTLKLSVEPDRNAYKATLKIEISDEGPRTILGEMEIVGSIKNSSEAMLTYLGLDSKATLTHQLREEIQRRLIGSGRFLRVQWELGEIDKRDDAWHPRLKVQEYELAPPLCEPLTREETALVKLAEWVDHFEHSNEQVLLHFRDQRVSLALAPQRGFIIALEVPPEAAKGGEPDFVSAIVMDEEQVGLYSLSQHRKIVAAPPPSPVAGQALITVVSGAPAWDGRSGLMLGAGMSTATQKGYRRHMTIQSKLAATAALSVVRKHEAKCRWEGDVLSVEWDHRQLRIDAPTGRLIEHVSKDDAPADGDHPTGDGDWSVRLAVKAGEFERRLAEIEKASADWPNAADPLRPLSCLAEFVCQEVKQFDAESQRGYAALDKAISLGLLEPFDKLACRACQPHEEGFSIPQPYFHFNFNSLQDLPATARALSPVVGVRLGNYLWPRESWINAVWRNGVFILAGKVPQLLSGELSGHVPGERGPLCAWLTAEMMHAVDLDAISRMYAGQGLRRLSLTAFHRDCGDLVSGQGFVSDCLLRVTDVIRQLDADEVDSLSKLVARVGLLNASQSALVQQCMASCQSDSSHSPVESATKALEAIWRMGLTGLVERRLKALASPPAPVAPTFTMVPGGEESPALNTQPTQPPLDRYGRPIFRDLPVQKSASENAGKVASIPEEAKPLKQEIRELKWLAQSITERLTTLEKRLEGDLSQELPASSSSIAAPAQQLPTGFGLDGCCPVTLIDKRSWRSGNVRFAAVHHGKTYVFVDAAAQNTFLSCPDRYSPVLDGNDVVLAKDKRQTVAGRREHGAFYRERIYLFANEDSLRAFNSDPERYVSQKDALAPAIENTVTKTPPPMSNASQIIFAGPEGMTINWDVTEPNKFDSEPLTVPGRYNFPQGAIYRLKLTNIPGREGVEFYPTLEIAPSLPRTDAYLAHNGVPVQFTDEDFDQVLSGNFVTKVIYLPDPEFQEQGLAGVETLISTRLDPGLDPIVEADRRGTILAIVRLGNADRRFSGKAASAATPVAPLAAAAGSDTRSTAGDEKK